MKATVTYNKKFNDITIIITHRKKILETIKLSKDESSESKMDVIFLLARKYPERSHKYFLKTYIEADNSLYDHYKKLYPRGGYRGGGRPKGTKTKRTQRFNRAVTQDERQYLDKCLKEYREKHAV